MFSFMSIAVPFKKEKKQRDGQYNGYNDANDNDSNDNNNDNNNNDNDCMTNFDSIKQITKSKYNDIYCGKELEVTTRCFPHCSFVGKITF